MNIFLYISTNTDPELSSNPVTGGLCTVRNLGYSHVPTLPSPTGLSHHSNCGVLCEVRNDRTINSAYSSYDYLPFLPPRSL